MHQALFIDPSIRLEKVAYDTRIDDDPESWPVSVIRESYKQLPFLKDYETEVEFDKVDSARGYAVGKMLVWPARMEKNAAADNKQLVTVPIIIRNREMAPLDVYTHSGSMMPMDQNKVAQVLFRPQMIEKAAPQGQFRGTNLYGQMTPPNTDHQYNAGSLNKHGSANFTSNSVYKAYSSALDQAMEGDPKKFPKPHQYAAGVAMRHPEVQAYAKKHGKKVVSIGTGPSEGSFKLKLAEAVDWSSLVQTFRSEDVNALGEKLASHAGLRHAYTTTPVLRAALADMLRAVDTEKTASATRDERLSHLKPTVVQVLESGNQYVIKTANHHCFEPLQKQASRFQVQELLSKEAFARLLQKGCVTFTTEPVMSETPSVKVASEASQLGVYKVWRSGREVEGVVVPRMMDFDGHRLDMQLFVGPEDHSMQEKVAGVFLRDVQLESDPPRGPGVFIYQEGPYAVATEPVNIQTTVKVAHESGSTGQLIGTRMSTGQPLQVTVVPGIKKIAMIGNEVALPESVRFLSLRGKSAAVSSTAEEAHLYEHRKVAGADSVELLSDGHCFALRGHNASAFPRQDMLGDEVEFALCALGLTGSQAQGVMKTASAKGHVRIPMTRMVVLESTAAVQSFEKAAHAVRLQPQSLRVDLVKELALLTSPKAEELWKQASVTLGKESVDDILSLGFVTPENASLYVGYLPEIEKVANKLAELLVASRLGLDDIRETAAKNAMTQVNAVVRGLESLRERIS